METASSRPIDAVPFAEPVPAFVENVKRSGAGEPGSAGSEKPAGDRLLTRFFFIARAFESCVALLPLTAHDGRGSSACPLK